MSDSRSRSPPPSRIPVWRGPPPRSASMTEAEVMASDLANPPSPDDSPPRHFSPSWCETPPSPPTPSSAAMDPVSVPVPGAASATCTCPICWLGNASASRGPVLPSAPAHSALLLQSPSRAHGPSCAGCAGSPTHCCTVGTGAKEQTQRARVVRLHHAITPVTSSKRVPTTLREDEKDLDDSD